MILKIGHIDVTVQPMTLREHIDEERNGSFNPSLMIIEIFPGLTPCVQAEILIHEIIHACYHAHDLKSASLDEETVCGQLDGPLAMVIKDNPGLLPTLQGALCNGKQIVTEKKTAAKSLNH